MLDHSQIRALLPQRYPFLLLDRVLSVEPGASICAIKAVTACEPCYAELPDGLGAESYAYPVSLLVESFGQAAALLWLISTASHAHEADQVGRNGAVRVPDDRADDGLLLFAAARDCVFESRAYPGDVLRHTVRLRRVLASTAFVEGETLVGRRRVAAMGSLIAAIRSGAALHRGLPGTVPITRGGIS